MILGIGSDLCDMRRIEKTIARFGDRFLDRVFTPVERAKAERRAGAGAALVATYARRFAAKEACAKALGTGLRKGVFWRDMGVENLPGGQPTLRLTGGAADRLRAMTPDGMTAAILLTMTDEPPIAEAMVVIEARPTAAAA